MNWFDIIKFSKRHNLRRLKQLENMFNNEHKVIGYIPIAWEANIVDEIKNTATKLGLEYKKYEERFQPTRPDGNSFSNGGHFMWDANKIEPHLEKLPFDTANDLIDFVAYTSYIGTPYRKIIDGLFGTANVKLDCER
jgi:hypothetical protein|tara:strand:- start:754 stop:1164 length:411 start_codon:yes stop_codon:yes gene_type:complete